MSRAVCDRQRRRTRRLAAVLAMLVGGLLVGQPLAASAADVPSEMRARSARDALVKAITETARYDGSMPSVSCSAASCSVGGDWTVRVPAASTVSYAPVTHTGSWSVSVKTESGLVASYDSARGGATSKPKQAVVVTITDPLASAFHSLKEAVLP